MDSQNLRRKARGRFAATESDVPLEWNPFKREWFVMDGQSLRTVRDVLVALGRANTSDNMEADHGAAILGVIAPSHRGRTTGTTLMKLDEFRDERNKIYQSLLKVGARRPKHPEIAKAMGPHPEHGHEWWSNTRQEPTSTYWDYLRQSKLTIR